MKTLNQKIVRILINHCEVLKHDERLIQVIPNGDIEEIANEIEQQVKNCDLADVGGSLPEADVFEDVICEIEGEYKIMTEYRIHVEPDSEDDKKMKRLFGWQ